MREEMVVKLKVGAIDGVVISAVAHEDLSVTVNGKPAFLAVVNADGRVIAKGDQVAREVKAVAVKSYRGAMKGQGHMRVCSEPIEAAA